MPAPTLRPSTYRSSRICRNACYAPAFYGLVELEYKLDARTDEYKLLDINARTWGYHSLGRLAGVDFPQLLFLDHIGEDVEPRRARPGVSWIRTTTDLPTALQPCAGGRALFAFLCPVGAANRSRRCLHLARSCPGHGRAGADSLLRGETGVLMAASILVGGALAIAMALALAWKWGLGVGRVALAVGWLGAIAGLVVMLVDALAPLAAVVAGGLTWLLTLAVATVLLGWRFYRDPERTPPDRDDVILSPADGEVIYVHRARDGVIPASSKHGRTYQLEELTKTALPSRDAMWWAPASAF